jgi:hypothetical protein
MERGAPHLFPGKSAPFVQTPGVFKKLPHLSKRTKKLPHLSKAPVFAVCHKVNPRFEID